ncbi:universal stress protein [Candidatus Magnetominusculus xianensis]|uniref:Universal stress protein n=1 Tax=Candidatus Magnetominusculus xianensis TaxID=1748249 RepID=A0ABR5SIA4_9BACT|nr:universal stress protein [Candidatus Magnetominusculus xianensis]KWT92153.1 putative universal stress protein [Candidatus Magnetominusculus xianensis]MBF0404676.1 universal stress protein [Nitrospirota bacterium]
MNEDKYRMNLMGELESILLATDGSQFSRGAIKEAINFARACKTVLTVLRVLEYNSEFETEGLEYVEEIERKAAAHFDEIRTLAAEENVECDIVVRRSTQAYETIIDEARKTRADIIIMGRRGNTGLKKLMMGSQTAKTIAHAPCKVLVVPKDTEIKGENIMLATDGSRFSEAAQAEAIMMAKRCPFVKNFLAVSVAKNDSRTADVERYLENVREAAEKAGVKVDTLALKGDPYKAIVNASMETARDIIIMGTHGRTGLDRLLMGSVAERVVALAMCSVLVTRTQ